MPLLPVRLLYLAAALIPAVSAQIAPSPKSGPLPALSPDLVRVHAVYQDHIRSRSPSSFEITTALGTVVRETVLIEASARNGDGAALLSRLEALGLEGGVSFGVLVNGRLPVAALGSVAELDALRAASIPMARTARWRGSVPPRPIASPVFIGAVTGEGAVALSADIARTENGVDGSGITIGVLSDSFDHCGIRAGDADAGNDCLTTADDDIASQDLPSNGVLVVEELAGAENSDEGRAMIQLARDIAPGAEFAFHTAFGGQASFAQGIIDLANAGATVIVDDVLNFGEPFFQDGVVAQAVGEVTARGIPYFSSAGNQADDSYEALFSDSGLDAAFPVSNFVITGDLHDFDPGPGTAAFQRVTIPDGASVRIAFQYAEPSFSASGGRVGSTSDYDILLLPTPTLTATPVASSVANNDLDENGSGEPVEVLQYENDTGQTQTLHFAIVLFSGEARFMKYIEFDGRAAFEFAQSGNSTSVAHNNAEGAMGVAAAGWFNTPPHNANIPNAITNSFSSFGGGEILFGPDGTRLAAPIDRLKPDVLASDGDNNTFFGSDLGFDDGDDPNFFGTSAAAPNVAAVAALMLEAAGGPGELTPSDIYAALEETADDVTSFELTSGNTANAASGPGYDIQTGNGFVRADRAVARVNRPVSAETSPSADAVSLTEIGPNPAQGAFSATLTVGSAQSVSVGLYDMLGRRVARVHDGSVAGSIGLDIDVSSLAPGLYVLRASGVDWTLSHTLSIVR